MVNISANTVINTAAKYIGVKENPPKSNNVIFNTVYYGHAVSGSDYPWCGVFQWYVFNECGAGELYYGGKKCAYTPTLANYYKSINRWYSTPKPGDLVFFKFSGSNRINHVGLVTKVIDGVTIQTIEGNTSSGNDANGGAVEQRTRSTKYIVGYGRPLYDGATPPSSAPSPSSNAFKDFVKELQAAIGAKVDGIPGPETLSKTPTLSINTNQLHPAVKPLQKYLNYLGYSCGSIDGEFRANTDKGVRKFQKTFLKEPDGEFTACNTSWKKILKLI